MRFIVVTGRGDYNYFLLNSFIRSNLLVRAWRAGRTENASVGTSATDLNASDTVATWAVARLDSVRDASARARVYQSAENNIHSRAMDCVGETPAEQHWSRLVRGLSPISIKIDNFSFFILEILSPAAVLR